GNVLDVVPSTEPHNDPSRGGNRRWLFRLSEVAVLDIPDFWQFVRRLAKRPAAFCASARPCSEERSARERARSDWVPTKRAVAAFIS
ncbi:hypothetical protein OMR07_09230, partial [Methylobacterium organophilum]|nr:hypothetical protein [Methylobacterium organophilum]